MKNLLFYLKAVKQLPTKIKSELAPKPEGKLFKSRAGAGAGSETNSFGSATLDVEPKESGNFRLEPVVAVLKFRLPF
jgi:hypothetical protein